MADRVMDGDGAPAPQALEMVPGLSAGQVEARLCGAARTGDVVHRVLAFYLNELEDRRLYQASGYVSAVHFAVARLDMSDRLARELLAIGRALRDLPALDAAFADRRLSWSKVRLLARVATAQTDGAWVAYARGVTCRQLRWDVKGRERGELPPDPDAAAGQGLPRVTFEVRAELDALGHEEWDRAKRKLEDETGRPVSNADMMREAARLLLSTQPDGTVPGRKPVRKSLYTIVVERDASEGRPRVVTADGPVAAPDEAVAAVLCDAPVEDTGHGTAPPAATVSRPLRGRVLARDGHRCRCCGRTWNVQVHHVVPVAAGGTATFENLVSLCGTCHALVHSGLLVVRGGAKRGFRFESRDGRPLDHSGASVGPAIGATKGGTRVPRRRRP